MRMEVLGRGGGKGGGLRTILFGVDNAWIGGCDHVARFESELEEDTVDFLEVGGCHGCEVGLLGGQDGRGF